MGPEMFEALQTGNVEIGVGPYNRVPEPLKFEPLINQPFFLIMRRDHPLALIGHARVADLEGLDLICPPRGMTAREILDRVVEAKGFSVQPKHEAAQFITLAGMVSLGLGMTVMPLSNRRMLESFDLVALPFVDAEFVREIGVLTRRGEPLTPPARAFKSLLILTTGSEANCWKKAGSRSARGARPDLSNVWRWRCHRWRRNDDVVLCPGTGPSAEKHAVGVIRSAMRAARRWLHSLSGAGIVLGTLFFAAALTPTLVPRTAVTQGVLAGGCFAIGYGCGVFGRWLWYYLELPAYRPRTRLIVNGLLAIASLAIVITFLWRATEWQNSIRVVMSMTPVESARPFKPAPSHS
jgi:hypothetical protein